MTTLYAWVRPTDIDKNVDHTWVTDYGSSVRYDTIDDVVKAGKNYWYCWGSYHPKGVSNKYPDGAIGNATGNLALSQCICNSNDTSAHGTIFVYAIDGVCHQVANQVLYSTNGPVTVKLARGYWLSSFLYGTYGSNKKAWIKKLIQCTGDNAMTTSNPPDDFEEKFNALTGDLVEAGQYDQLMELRHNFQRDLNEFRSKLSSDNNIASIAEQVNALIREYMMRAQEIVGPEVYQQLFEIEANQSLNLVEPEFVDLESLLDNSNSEN